MSHGGAQTNSPTPSVKRLGVEPYQWGTECLSGDVFAGPATSFPMSINMASAFDAPLLTRTAHATAIEVRAKNNDAVSRGIHQFHTGLSCWSPVINIARHPLWGRNQETYGEDPLLNGALAAAFVTGLQGNSSRYLLANAGCKHFAGFAGPVNSNEDHTISERDLQTTYLPQFKMCVDAGAWSFMCSYSAVNGVPSCGSPRLLTDILRTEWAFPGYVVSDQTALEQIAGVWSPRHESRPAGYAPYNKSVAAAAALIAKSGCDLADSNWNFSATTKAKPSNVFASLARSVHDGLVEEATLDTAVKRLFAVRFRLGEFDPQSMTKEYTGIPLSVVQSEEHMALALEAAQESMVLLKNGNQRLPLSASKLSGKRIALLGPFARAAIVSPGPSSKCAGRGPLYYGDYGAGPFEPYWKLPSPWTGPTARDLTVTMEDAMKKRVDTMGGTLLVEPGCDTSGCAAAGVCNASTYDPAAITAAVESADVVVVCLGTSLLVEAEGIDRPDLSLPGAQEKLLRQAASALPPTSTLVVLLFNAGGVDVSWAVESDSVHAIVAAGFPGQATGDAVVDTLFGDVVPAGRLAVTWPKSLAQVPAITNYAMSGSTYRYLQPDPLFPFGYGLSYTTFAYSDIAVAPQAPTPCEPLSLHVTVRNTGKVDADEVVMAFVEWTRSPQPTPDRALAAFARVHVRAGEARKVTLELPPAQLAVLAVPGVGNATSTWMASAVSMRLSVGGQQPGMAVHVPSNVLQMDVDVVGKAVPLKEC